MRLVILALLVPAVASANPAPSFDVLDRGTAVEVIAHNVTALKTAITPIRSRLEVPLLGHPRADKALPTDATVKLVEFDGNEPRVMSIKLGFERPEVMALAKYAQAIQVGPDVHIMFPRVVPAEGAAIVLPEPTLPADLAAKLAAAKPVPVPVTPASVVAPVLPPPAVTPEVKHDVAPEPVAAKPTLALVPPKTEGKPAAATTTTAPTTKPATVGTPAEDGWQKLSLYAAIGLAAVGCGVWMLRRRKATQGVTSSIDVIAQKSLGAKAKVVWFTAGGREMVVACSASGRGPRATAHAWPSPRLTPMPKELARSAPSGPRPAPPSQAS